MHSNNSSNFLVLLDLNVVKLEDVDEDFYILVDGTGKTAL